MCSVKNVENIAWGNTGSDSLVEMSDVNLDEVDEEIDSSDDDISLAEGSQALAGDETHIADSDVFVPLFNCICTQLTFYAVRCVWEVT
jgi:hypothetical protein